MQTSSSKATALNAHLPTHLQLDESPGLEAELDQAAANGWTPDGLAAHITRKAGATAGPGLAYRLIQQAARTPQQKGAGGTPSPTQHAIDTHPFDQDPNNQPGWCRCNLPTGNHHHTP